MGEFTDLSSRRQGRLGESRVTSGDDELSLARKGAMDSNATRSLQIV